MRTLPQGYRQDPVPSWDKGIDDAIKLRERLRKIRDDKTPSSATLEQRRQSYIIQAEITRKLIRTKRATTWQKFATDNLRYTEDSRMTAAIIKLLVRAERPSALQTLKDKRNREYETDKEKASAFQREISMKFKPVLKPLGRDMHGKTDSAQNWRMHQKKKIRQYIDTHTAAPPASRAVLSKRQLHIARYSVLNTTYTYIEFLVYSYKFFLHEE